MAFGNDYEQERSSRREHALAVIRDAERAVKRLDQLLAEIEAIPSDEPAGRYEPGPTSHASEVARILAPYEALNTPGDIHRLRRLWAGDLVRAHKDLTQANGERLGFVSL